MIEKPKQKPMEPLFALDSPGKMDYYWGNLVIFHVEAHANDNYKRVSSVVSDVWWKIEVVDGGFAGALELKLRR